MACREARVCRRHDANADERRNRSPGCRDGNIRDVAAQPFSSRERAVTIAVGGDDQEFFPSITADRVTCPDRCGKATGEFPEDLITD